jgi:hypothetical protein
VEPAPERDDAGLSGGAPSQLDRAVHRLGAAVAEEHLRVVEERSQPGDGLGGRDVRLMLQHHRRVEEPVDLGMDGRDHVGVAVPGVRHRDPRAEIEIALAIDVPHPRADGPVGDHIEVRREHRGHDCVVALQPAPSAGGVIDGGHASLLLSICARCRRPE